MNTIDNKQKQQIHAILAKMGRGNDKEFKKGLVLSFTNNRETSTTGMTYEEAQEMIIRLNASNPDIKKDSSNRMRRAMIYLAYKMNWAPEGQWTYAIPRIDKWVRKYGHLKDPTKGMNDYTYEELPKLLTQLQRVYDSFLRGLYIEQD